MRCGALSRCSAALIRCEAFGEGEQCEWQRCFCPEVARDWLPFDLARQIFREARTIRRAQHPQRTDIFPDLMKYRLAVAELAEAVIAVVGAHAGRPDTAERQFLLRDMHHHVVDRYAA